MLMITTDQLAYLQICLKYLSDLFFVNDTVLRLNSCQNASAVSAKVTVCIHCLLAMFEKWKSAIDKEKSFGALLADLSKAFDRFSH